VPSYCFPPSEIGVYEFEPTARGVLPRAEPVRDEKHLEKGKAVERASPSISYMFSDANLTLGPLKKRKAEKSLDEEAVSKTRYDGYRFKNPALHRHNATLSNPRPPYMPAISPEHEVAMQRSLKHIDLLPVVDGGAASFLPPSTIFNNVGPERVLRYTTMLLQLWPFLLHRISLARSDSNVRPLTAKAWRSVLGGEFWKDLWPKDKRDDFKVAVNYWRYGSDVIFGKELSLQVRQGRELQLGRLICGCEPTLDIVTQCKILITDVVSGLAQWEHLLQLAALAPGSVAKSGVPVIKDHGRELCVPNFYEDKQVGVLALIKTIALGGQDVPSCGWPYIFCGWELRDEVDLRKWLLAVREFFLQHAAHRAIFDNFEDDWIKSAELLRAQIRSLRVDKLEPMAQEFLARYFVLCFRQGQMPPEVHMESDVTQHSYLRCNKCSGRLDVLKASDYDLSDEE
jgi:hypothetical protein